MKYFFLLREVELRSSHLTIRFESDFSDFFSLKTGCWSCSQTE